MSQTATDRVSVTRKPVLAVTDQPSIEQLRVWWEAMQSDDLSVAYADSFPSTLHAFRLEVARGDKTLLLCLAADQVAGALWLHDMLHRPDGTVSAGWIGAYFLPAYRGHTAIQWWQAARHHWETAGITHYFSAIHIANRLSRALIVRGTHFHRVGRFPQFLMFHGQPADVFIYTLHVADTALAWELATARATRQRLNMMPSVQGAGNRQCVP